MQSPVHNERFWRENALKFEDDDYKLVRLIISQLSSNNEEALEVACYDLGEFARFHPDGKRYVRAHVRTHRLRCRARVVLCCACAPGAVSS